MIIHTTISKKKLCLTVNLSKSDSLPTSPTAAAATAIDCGEIILPTTPPDALAATATNGSIPTPLAVTCCSLPNSKLADVSDPVMNTPIQPSAGDSTKNAFPVAAKADPKVFDIPEAFMMYAKPTTKQIVNNASLTSENVSIKVLKVSFQLSLIINLEINAATRIPVPIEPIMSNLNTAAISL